MFLKSFGLIVILVVIYLFFLAYRYARDSPLVLSSKEARIAIKSGLIRKIVDVRTDLERATLGYYPGSIHIPAGSKDFDTLIEINIPQKGEHILLYCNTGQRARAAAEKLAKKGYSHVNYIVGSYTELLD